MSGPTQLVQFRSLDPGDSKPSFQMTSIRKKPSPKMDPDTKIEFWLSSGSKRASKAEARRPETTPATNRKLQVGPQDLTRNNQEPERSQAGKHFDDVHAIQLVDTVWCIIFGLLYKAQHR